MKRLTFLISVLSISISPIANSQSIVQVNPLPNTTYWNQAWGLAPGNGGARLAISSGTTTAVFNRGHIYSSDSLGNIRDSVVTGLSSSQGLAWDGSHYWYIRGSGSTGRIYKVNTAGAIVDSIIPPSTSWFLGGACWDGTGLWVSLYSPNADAGLYKYNVVTKTIVDTIRSIGQQPQGIAWDGQYLYYAMDLNSTEPNQNLIYVVNPTTRDTVRTIPMPEPPNVDSNPRGLAWDGRYLWLVAEPVGASSGRSLYKYDLGGSGTPDINLVPASLDFGLERIDSTYTRTFEIQNVGTAPLIFDIACTLGHWWCGSSTVSPDTIPPGGSVEWQIYNRPFFFGADQFFLPIMSNDPDESFINYRLFGYAIYGPPVMIVPTQLNFGTRRIGTSSSIPLTIQNLGAQRLTISSIVSSLNVFSVDSLAFPIHVDSLQSTTVRVLFTPGTVGNFSAQLQIVSNAAGGGVRQVALSGVGEASSILMGQPFWTYVVPNNPRTSSNQKLMKAVRAISDINGDGKPEVVVSSENYYTMALNGNASVSNDSLWAFNTYIANYSAGSIGSTGDYSHQKALAVADLNRDSFKDVIIGTGGGNEHVYAINGRTGQMLWQFGTDHPDSFSLGDFTGVDASMDFTGDGVPDVLGAAAATETGGVGGRRSVYLFNGTNGHIRWIAPLLGFTHAVTAIPDVNGDGVPDVIGTVGEPSYKFQAFSGANGSELWQLPVPSAQGGGKEVLPWLVAGQSPDAILSAFWGPVYRVNAVNGTIRWQYSTGNRGVLQLARLRDVTGDGVDEVCAALLLGGAVCLNGANGTVIWSLPTGNTMGVAAIPDLNRDGYDDVALAVQNQGVMIVKGQDGAQLALYPTGTQQSREVAIVPDLDGNNSFEIIMGGQQGNVALLSGGSGATSVGGDANVIPKYFELRQNYPNPFNPTTTIEVRLPQQSDFTLTIYDVLGREVRAFKYEKAATGTHQIGWEGNDNAGNQAATGIYVYVFRTKDLLTAKKMLLLR
jgi:hypothetical protein